MSRHRQSTTPMDFEWDNKRGPLDENSPFITSVNQSAKKRPPFGQPGTHSVFDSPSKTAFATPNRPQLREPHGENFYFTQNKPLPSIPSHVQNSKTWEPRTPPQNVVDFSSGGETPNTPAQDSDAATPETQLASRMGTLTHGDKKSPRKSKRESLFRLFSSNSPSPSKEETRKPYSKKAENRIMKRRSKKSKTELHEDYDSDNEQNGTRSVLVPQPAPSIGFAANIPGALAWVEAHPNLPAVLSFYMQFIVNAVLGFLFLYIIYAGYSAVANDIDIEARKKAGDIMHDIAVCTEHYKTNMCDAPRRVPALQEPCQNWERCMSQDAFKIARASVGARTFAMIFNSFVEEFSYKSMLFSAIILFGGFNLSNWAFGLIREKNPQHQRPQHYDYPPPPATPQRSFSGGFIDQNGNAWHTPYGTPYGSVNHHMLQQASQSVPALPSTAGAADEMEIGGGRMSPRKKDVFRR